MSDTALAIRKTAMPVSSMGELAQAGELIARSGLCGVKDAAGGFIVALACHQENMSVLDFPKKYHIIQNRLSMRADAMLAEFRSRGGRYKIVEASTTKAEILVTWEGSTIPFAYTMEDGHRTGDALAPNGKLKDNWQKRPEAMLWARCVSRMVRMLCPEVVAGVYTPEEIEDIPAGSSVAPVSVSVETAVAKAKTVKAEVREAKATAAVDTSPKQVDYEVCPDGFGDYSGKRWFDMPDDVLVAAMGFGGLAGEYRDVIGRIVEERTSHQGGLVYAIGRPDQRNQGSFGMYWGPNPDRAKAFNVRGSAGDVLFEMRQSDGEPLKSYLCDDDGVWNEQERAQKAGVA